jgi:hypothetical protein
MYLINYAGNEGEQKAFTFRKPEPGTVFGKNEVWLLPGAQAAPTNSNGEIPNVEDGPKGVSWSAVKE